MKWSTRLTFFTAALVPALAAAQGEMPDSAVRDTGYVVYQDSPLDFPLLFGIRIPSYDRINGLTLPFGPRLTLGEDRFEANALVTYRSNLGKLDPSGTVRFAPGLETWILATGGRGTFTNDRWIRGDLVNSIASFGVGSDARNYYRADQYALSLGHTLQLKNGTMEPFVGGQVENAWSTGSRTPPAKSPWSLFGRSGDKEMKRPNPAVTRGRIESVIAGSDLEWEKDKVSVIGNVKFESAFDAPQGTGNFRQLTLDLASKFPALLDHRFEFRLHWLTTGNGVAPPQRFAYLGGAGTIATMDLLEQGGDRLFFVSGLYTVPIKQITLPIVGNPFVGVRYAAGSAGIGKLPPLVQNVTAIAGIRFARIEYSYDPSSKESSFSIGLSLSP